ncbi:MAG: zinc-ribbon domain-containing protein [Lachnospira sp.]
MFCPNCGTKNEDDAVFCGNCGTSLAVNQDTSAPEAVAETVTETVAETVTEATAETAKQVEPVDEPVVTPQPDFSAQAPQYNTQPDFSAQAPQFNAQPDFGAQAPQFNAQPAPKKEKKAGSSTNILKIIIPIAAAVVVLIALVCTFVGIGKSKTDYKKTAKTFVENYVKGDWEAVYDSMDVPASAFVSKETFVTAMSSQTPSTLMSSTYTDTFSQTSAMYEGKAVLVMYTTPEGSSSLTLNLKPQQKKKMLFFTEYKVDASDFLVKDCIVKVPSDMKASVNGIELNSNYIDKDSEYSSTTMTTYKLPYLFSGSATIKLSADGMEDIEVKDVIFDENEDVWTSSDYIAMNVKVSVPTGGFTLSVDGEEVSTDLIDDSYSYNSSVYYVLPFLKIGEHTFKVSGDIIDDYEYKTNVSYDGYSVYIGSSNMKLSSTVSSTVCKQAEEDFKKITDAAAAGNDMSTFSDRLYDSPYNNYNSIKNYLTKGYTYSNLKSSMTTKSYSYDYSSKLPMVTVKLEYVETTKSGSTYNEYGNIEYVYSNGKWMINEFYFYF